MGDCTFPTLQETISNRYFLVLLLVTNFSTLIISSESTIVHKYQLCDLYVPKKSAGTLESALDVVVLYSEGSILMLHATSSADYWQHDYMCIDCVSVEVTKIIQYCFEVFVSNSFYIHSDTKIHRHTDTHSHTHRHTHARTHTHTHTIMLACCKKSQSRCTVYHALFYHNGVCSDQNNTSPGSTQLFNIVQEQR